MTDTAPSADKPDAVQAAIRAEATETEDARITITIQDGFMKEHDRKLALHVGILGAEPEAILIGRTNESLLLRLADHFFARDETIEVEDDELALTWLKLSDWKPLRGDPIPPIVLPILDETFEGLVIRNGDRELETILHLARGSKNKLRASAHDVLPFLEHERDVCSTSSLRKHGLLELHTELQPNFFRTHWLIPSRAIPNCAYAGTIPDSGKTAFTVARIIMQN